ncbi:hypothetical protein ACWCP6_00740 [Streptomyces sp. NPDC002004]
MVTTTRRDGAPGGARARPGRLLLFTALLLGIVTMHTLGHPAEHGMGDTAMSARHATGTTTAFTGRAGTTAESARHGTGTLTAPTRHGTGPSAASAGRVGTPVESGRRTGALSATAVTALPDATAAADHTRPDMTGATTVADHTQTHMTGATTVADHTQTHMTGATTVADHTQTRAAGASRVAAGPPTPAGTGSHGLDPMSVCLAVLGGFTLLVLLGGLLHPRAYRRRPGGPARLPHALHPEPPPPRALFSRLSVLRL